MLASALAVGVLVLAAGGLLFSAGFRQAEAARAQDGSARASDPVSPETLTLPDEEGVAPALRREQATGEVQVLVELNDAPTTQVYAEVVEKSGLPRAAAEALANRAAQTQLSVIGRAQESLAAAMQSRFRASEIYRVQRVLNGIAVSVDAGHIEALRRTPGVKGVHVLVPEYPSNSTSVPFLGVPQLWDNSLNLLPDLTGRNIKVGIIDTGIDYLHANFGGPATRTAYEANDRTVAPDIFFPTAKVVGGIDLAGDRYNASASSSAATTDTAVPQPDPDPMDCNSHGTHVAGSAAGLGVNSDGTTYTGPYGVATPFSSLRIGPGTAPGAQLYAIRVFGCIGTTTLSPRGLEHAVDPNGDGNFSDRLDVVNLSLGSGYGSGFNPTEQAANNAALAGVFVVASAGNSGDTYFITGAPGSAKRALSVASSADPGAGAGGSLRVNPPSTPPLAGEKPAATVGYGPAPNGQTADVALVDDGATNAQPNPSPSPTPIANPTGTTTDACQPLVNAAQVAGKIAIADRGLCTAKTKTLNAQNAGAVGLIIVNNVATDIAPPGFSDDGNITTPITIPTLVVTQADGNAIKQELAAGRTVNVTFRAGTAADTLSAFSSRGPRRAELPLRLKPDIAAPGQTITSSFTGIVQSQSGNEPNPTVQTGAQPGSLPLTISGTSMAAPHVAGIMALLRQLHPDWSVEELKAAAMNGAIRDVFLGQNNSGPRFGPGRVGAGRVVATNSAANTAVAYDADDSGAVSVSAFEGEVLGTVSGRARTIRVANKGTADLTYTLGIDTVTDAPGVQFSLPGGTTLTVPAGQTRTFNVAMNAVADQMDHTRDATVSSVQVSNARQFLTEEGAYVTFSQDGQLKMRVPVYAAPRPASAMHATDMVATGGAVSGLTALALPRQDVCTGTRPGGAPDCTGSFPTDVVSLVTPFELQVNDPADANVPAHGDLRYAGVSYDGSLLHFGVATYGDWTWPGDVEFDIFIDANEDGAYERVIFNTLLASGQNGTDVFISVVQNLSTGATSAVTFLNGVSGGTRDTALYNNNVMFIPVTPASIGLTGGDTTFRYRIDVFTDAGRTDRVGLGTFGGADSPLFFNYAAPGLSFPTGVSSPNNSGILFADLDTRTIPVNFNRTNLTTNRSLGALLLHHFNVRGTRAEVATVQGTTTQATDLAVGMAVDTTNPPLNSNVTFTVVASNPGPTNATNVRVLDKLPAGLEFVSATPSVGSYNSATGVWTVGSLASGATATLQLVAAVRTTDAVTNTARVAGADQLDTNGANDQVSVQVSAPRSADLRITLTSNPTAATGSAVAFTTTVTNLGEDAAHNIVVTTGLTPALTITGAAPTSGVFNAATGVWNIASLGKGNSATLTFTVTAPITCDNIVAAASVTSETADPNTLNNSAAATVNVEPSATLQFSQATYTVTEEGTAVTATVTLQGTATSFPFSVDYTTADGTASSRSDYNTAVGTLEFAAGETSKTITVLINEDSHVEGTETFTIVLSNSSSCEVGPGGPATVQINDDPSEPSTNAIDDTANFVRQHYHDFLNREPDPSGFAFWVNEIEQCGADAQCREVKRIHVSAAFFLSIEFQQTGFFVYRAFTAAFGPTRVGGTVPLTLQEFLPDTQQLGSGVIVGQGDWQARLEANKDAYLLEFVQRPAFTAQYPNTMTPEQFVDALNANTGNSLTTAERDALVAQLTANNTTQGRADVLRAVIDNDAFESHEFNRAFVLMQYFGYLRRNPNDPPDADFSGYNFWLAKLNSFNGDFVKAEMVKAFISSSEYRQRFGQN